MQEQSGPLIVFHRSSKTLSALLTFGNLQGEQSKSDVLKSFHRIHPFRYQCSEYSSDKQVEAVYQSAISRQRMLFTHGSFRKERSVVLLDEASLVENAALKATHYVLDHPVSTEKRKKRKG